MSYANPTYYLSAWRDRTDPKGYAIHNRLPFPTLAAAMNFATRYAIQRVPFVQVPYMAGILNGEIDRLLMEAPSSTTSHDKEAREWWIRHVELGDDCRTILIESRLSIAGTDYTLSDQYIARVVAPA